MELMFAEWEDGERFSFEDSDRFEEDSLCSFISEAESLCQNWRGWRKQSAGPNSPTVKIKGRLHTPDSKHNTCNTVSKTYVIPVFCYSFYFIFMYTLPALCDHLMLIAKSHSVTFCKVFSLLSMWQQP